MAKLGKRAQRSSATIEAYCICGCHCGCGCGCGCAISFLYWNSPDFVDTQLRYLLVA